MFVVQVAADIFSSKTNFELQFPSRPTLPELIRATETAFSNEIALRRPDGVPPHSFHVAKLKFYDEDRNKWVDLLSEAQLADYVQCYAFQPENQWHKETQREIPAAVRPPTNVAPYTNSRSGASTPYQPYPSSATYQPAAALPQKAVVAQPLTSTMSRDATQDEKVRTVFQEFDHKNHRMIDMDDLMQGFRTLGLEFTTATMNDLFQKGDLNNDGRISYSEFERFANLYPIMIDCLFYRTKAFWDDQNMQREIEAEHAAVRDARNLVAQAEQQLRNAQKAVEDATRDVMNCEADIKDRNDRVRQFAKDLDQAQRDKERAMKEKYDKESEVMAQRDRERQARQIQQDAAREVEKSERRSSGLQIEAQKADEKVKLLQAQLAEAQRLFDRAAGAARQAQQETDVAHSRAQEAARQADALARELPRFDDALRQAESNAALALERVREIESLTRDVAREIEEIQRRREAIERQAAAGKDHENNMAQEVAHAKRNADERERLAKAREAELLEQQRQRQLLTQQERQLIEQELRLREQRESLEQKENVLRNEAVSFLATLRNQQNAPRSGSSQYPRDTSFSRNDSTSYRY
jgi:hypothetical protein